MRPYTKVKSGGRLRAGGPLRQQKCPVAAAGEHSQRAVIGARQNLERPDVAAGVRRTLPEYAALRRPQDQLRVLCV